MLSPAMATMLAVVTTDAAIDRAALQRALAAAVSESFDCLNVDGCALHQRHRARARRRPGGPGRRRTRSPMRSPRCALRSPSRWPATPKGATKFARVRVVGARTDADARIAAARRRQQPARAVFAQRCRSVLGPHPVGARCERRAARSRARRDLVQRCRRVPRRHRLRPRRGRARACDGRSRHRDPRATCTSGTAKRRCSRPTSRTRTSTRTAAPHDADA